MLIFENGKLLIKTVKKPDFNDLEAMKKYLIGLLNKIEKAGFQVGTIRTWNGKKYKKVAKDKWMRYYEGKDRGQEQAVRNVIKKIEGAKSVSELAEIIRLNRNRFKDADGSIDSVVKQFLESAKGKRPEKIKKIEEISGEKKDKEITKEIQRATPENRVEIEAKVMDYPKEDWALTWNEYKEKMFNYRNPAILSNFDRQINFYEKEIAKNESPQYVKYAENNLKSYKDAKEKYLDGSVDDKLNNNPTWDYMKRKYDSLEDKNSAEAKSLKRKISIKENKAKSEHERLIKLAIKDNKTIPANVLKDYPEIQNNEAKEMTVHDVNYKPVVFEKTFYMEGLEIPEHKKTIKVNDYSKINAVDVYLVNEDNILDIPRPSYIPELDLKSFMGYKGERQKFDIARINANEYIIVDKGYPVDISYEQYEMSKRKEITKDGGISGGKYFLMSAETLAATWDYYTKLYKQTIIKEHELKQDREEINYNKAKQKALDSGKKWIYAPFKRTGIKPKVLKPQSGRMTVSQGFLIQDMLGFQGDVKSLYRGELNNKVFNNYHDMLIELDYKINDLQIQKAYNEENDTFKKGEETSYGDIGLKDDLIKSHGVKVKRQNGKEIDKSEIAKIGMVMDDVFSVFGDRKSMSEKYGLKISYAGDKKMHASKADGLFIDSYKCIAISDSGIEGRGFTFAHEFAHFMDSYLGKQKNNHFLSDVDGSTASNIAKTFRSNLYLTGASATESNSKYAKRTCECFARALEQYYSIKQGTEKTLYEERNKNGMYVNHDYFIKNISPMIDQFFKENDNLLKSMRIDLMSFKQER